MAQLLQQSSQESPRGKGFKGQDIKFEFDAKIINSVTASQEETERMFYRKEQAYGDEGNLFFKSTERQFPAYALFNQVWLTQDSGSASSKRSEWSPKILEKSDKGGLLQAYNLLEQNGLMEIFQSFEVLRSYIVDEMANASESHYSKLSSKISLYQIIAEFKAKVFQMQEKDEVSEERRDHDELKDILKQLNFFRNENKKLKDKIQEICVKFEQSHRKNDCNNSILDNSVTFEDDSSVLSSRNINISDISIDLRLQKLQSDVINPFSLAKQESGIIQTYGFNDRNIFASNSEGSDQFESFDSESSQKTINEPIQEQSSYIIQTKQSEEKEKKTVDQTHVCFELKEEWISALTRSIKCLRNLFRKYVASANLALMKTQFMKDLSKLLEEYNSHNPYVQRDCQLDFIRESNRMMELISNTSEKLSLIISNQLLSHKRPALKALPSFNK